MRLLPQILLLALFAGYAAAACAQDGKDTAPATKRLCTEQDLKGVFMLVDFHETPEGLDAEMYHRFPYRYVEFFPDKGYVVFATNLPKKSAKELNASLNALHRNTRKYVLAGEGILDLYNDRKIDYHYRCVATLLDNGAYKKKDLILTGYSPNGVNESYNLYRFWYQP